MQMAHKERRRDLAPGELDRILDRTLIALCVMSPLYPLMRSRGQGPLRGGPAPVP